MLPLRSVWTGVKAAEPRRSDDKSVRLFGFYAVSDRRTEETDDALRSLEESKSVDAGVCDGNVRKGLRMWVQSKSRLGWIEEQTDLDSFEVGSHVDGRRR